MIQILCGRYILFIELIHGDVVCVPLSCSLTRLPFTEFQSTNGDFVRGFHIQTLPSLYTETDSLEQIVFDDNSDPAEWFSFTNSSLFMLLWRSPSASVLYTGWDGGPYFIGDGGLHGVHSLALSSLRYRKVVR